MIALNDQTKFKTLRFFLVTLAFRLLLDYLYIFHLSTDWEYMGFHLIINPEKLIISYFCLVILSFMMAFYNPNKFSHFFVILLFYTVYTPIGSLYGMMDVSHTFFWYSTVSFLLFTYFIVVLSKPHEVELIKEGKLYNSLTPLLHVISLYAFFAMTLQNLNNINLLGVLDLRSVYSVRQGVSYGLGMSYLFSWQTKVITPFMMSMYYHNRNWKAFFVYVALQLWMFMITGHKQVLFLIIVVLLIINFSKYLKDLPAFMSWGLLALIGVVNVEFLIRGASAFFDFFIRRMLFLTALISNYYYEFFSAHGLQYWSYSIVGRILNLKQDFAVEPPFLIGEVYFGNPKTNAVSGFLGTDYMNGGVAGVLFATITIIVIFKLIEFYAERIGRDIVLITMIGPTYALWNTGILTAMLTGGLAMVLLVLHTTKIRDPKEERRAEKAPARIQIRPLRKT